MKYQIQMRNYFKLIYKQESTHHMPRNTELYERMLFGRRNDAALVLLFNALCSRGNQAKLGIHHNVRHFNQQTTGSHHNAGHHLVERYLFMFTT